AVVVSSTREPNFSPPSLTLEQVRSVLTRARPLRPADSAVAETLHRACSGRIGVLVDLLEKYPGDELINSAQRGVLVAPATALDSVPARTLAQIYDPLSSEILSQLGVEPRVLDGMLSSGMLVRLGDGLVRTTRRLRQHAPPEFGFPLSEDVLPLTYAVHTPSRSPQTLIENARRAQAEGREEDAVELYRLVGEQPGIAVELANFLGTLGRHEEALEALTNAQDPSALLARAKLLLQVARYADAARAASHHDDSTRDESEAIRARALLLSRDYEQADALVKASLDRAPNHPFRAELLDTQGLIHFYRGDTSEARSVLEDALAIAADLEDASRLDRVRSHLAVVLHKAGDLAEAENAYRAALDGAKSRGAFQEQLLRQVNLATLQQDRGKWSQAIASYERAGELSRIVGDERAAIRNALNWSNLLGWLGDHASAEAMANLARAQAEHIGMETDAAYLALLEAEQRIAQNRDVESLLASAARVLEDSTTARADLDLVRAQAALRSGDNTRGAQLAHHALELAQSSERETLEVQAAIWCLLARVSGEPGERNVEIDRLGAHAQLLADRREDPDSGWLLACLRAELGPSSERDEHLATARRLASDARARLSSEQERSYSRVWYRSQHWTAIRSVPAALPQDVTRDFDRLIAINRELARDHDPERLLDRIIDAAIALSGAERGFIVLCNEVSASVSENDLHIHSGRNLDRESLSGERLSRSIAAQAINSATAITTVDASGDSRFKEALSVAELKLRSVLCLPLRTQGGALGALYLDNRYRAHAFSEADVSLLSAFGDQAAIALANARLVSELDRKARELERMKAEVEVVNQRLETELEARHQELHRGGSTDHSVLADQTLIV
ncbi:MAG: GAF domain-containing protein, partial [Myxococcota bacterium]